MQLVCLMPILLLILSRHVLLVAKGTEPGIMFEAVILLVNAFTPLLH